jgi:hypothetical protein
LCGLNEYHTNWGENIFCEGLATTYGRCKQVYDYIYPGLSFFWLFKSSHGEYEACEKKYNSKTWEKVE